MMNAVLAQDRSPEEAYQQGLEEAETDFKKEKIDRPGSKRSLTRHTIVQRNADQRLFSDSRLRQRLAKRRRQML